MQLSSVFPVRSAGGQKRVRQDKPAVAGVAIRARVIAPVLRAAALVAVIAWATTAQAHVTSLTIDATAPAFGGATVGAGASARTYQIITGREFGKLDPKNPLNAIIQDIDRAPKNPDGTVSYVATFQVLAPSNVSDASGLMIYEVVNRGNSAIPNYTTAAGAASIVPGAIYVQSGWQGDLLAHCTTGYPCTDLTTTSAAASQLSSASPGLQEMVIQVPVAHHKDGSTITGPIYSHITLGQSGSTGQLVVFSTPVPYDPADVNDRTTTRFWSDSRQSITGLDEEDPQTIAPSDWRWADCRTVPFPGTPDPTRVCLKNGFDASRLYQMVFPAKDPLVLGTGYAAVRDLIAYLHHSTDSGNPVAGHVTKVLSAGVSQSAAFIRSSIHLGFNQDESGLQVLDGAWSDIDGRQLFMNVRFALPDVITNLYMMADEAPVWWADWPDTVRHHPPAGILDRCRQTQTCPEILETFGSDELYEEKMSPDLIGTDASADIPLPPNVHRYYLPSTTHGGGGGGFTYTPASSLPLAPGCTAPANPNPETDTLAALETEFIAMLMTNQPMPPNQYPLRRNGTLVPAVQWAIGFPNIPSYPWGGTGINHPEAFDFGPRIDYYNQTGVITREPPGIFAVEPEWVPPVDLDGNETVGVASVLLQAPLATYSGWNTYASGPFQGQQCSLSGGSWPFAETKAERDTSGDPRFSLEERYGTHAGYVCVVTNAANRAVKQKFLLPAAAAADVTAAQAGNVLTDIAPTAEDAGTANRLCSTASRWQPPDPGG